MLLQGDVFEPPLVTRISKDPADRGPRREVVRESSLGAAVLGLVEDRVPDLPRGVAPRDAGAAVLRPRHRRANDLLLHVHQVGRVRPPAHGAQVTGPQPLRSQLLRPDPDGMNTVLPTAEDYMPGTVGAWKSASRASARSQFPLKASAKIIAVIGWGRP